MASVPGESMTREETCNPDKEVIVFLILTSISSTSTLHSSSTALPDREEPSLSWFDNVSDTRRRSGKLDGPKRYLIKW